MTEDIFSVTGLKKYYNSNPTLLDRFLTTEPPVKAVDGISFTVKRGETLGLVGESGCGKSTTGETLLRLHEPTQGTVRFEGKNLSTLSDEEYREFRRNVQIVFQDPFNSLNPRMTVGQIIREPFKIHDIGDTNERKQRVEELLEQVGLSSDYVDRYPHEFSGGQLQRISIARALALEPDFIVLDEPVSALDMSVQAQILNLLSDLQNDFDLTYLLIAHDLSVVRHISDRVAVMYLGKIVEVGPVDRVFDDPAHPYTNALLNSVPKPGKEDEGWKDELLAGNVPSPRNPPEGCRFHTRCPHAKKFCREKEPDLVSDSVEAHETSCFKVEGRPEYQKSSDLN